MTQSLPKLGTYTEFIEWFPNDGKRYELHNGVIIEMPSPTGEHEKVVRFLVRKITVEYDRLNLPYTIPKTVFVKTPCAETVYSPDVLLLNLANLPKTWLELWHEWNQIIWEASQEEGKYIVQEEPWEEPYFDNYTFVEDLEAIAKTK